MERTRSAALAVALFAAVLLAAGLATGSRAEGMHPGAHRPDSLAVLAVDPDSVPNDLDTAIVITGTGFAVLSGTQVITPPAVFLGQNRLPEVTWVSSTRLLSTVPWGLVPGLYTVTVTNPGGASAALTGALTVTQAIGVWTSDGPYGGSVLDLAVDPADAETVFAIVPLAGLFVSRDGGGRWERTGLDWEREASEVAYGPASTATLLAGGVGGLWATADGGRSWGPIYDGGAIMTFAQHPTDAGILYISRWDQGIFRSADGGQTWENRSDGIDPLRVRRIVVDPASPATLYAATDRYGLFKSTDEGLHWAAADAGLADDPDDNFYEPAVDPFDPDSVWAVGVYGGQLFHSADGAQSWATIPITYPVQRALAFSPVTSETLYAGATHDLAVSRDGGATWGLLNLTPLRMIEEIAVDPATGVPIYLGSNGGGAYRSADGGLHWERVVEGMTGIEPRAVVPAPSEPERLYFMAVDGAFRSQDGGRSWVKDWEAEMWIAAVDPVDGLVAYVSPTPGWGACTIARTADGGLTWTPQTVCGEPDRYVTSLTVHPADRRVLLAGGGDNWGHFASSHGWLARSEDGGDTWQELALGRVISDVTSVVVDPVVTQTLVLASCTIHPYWNLGSQSGIYRSTDGGATWATANDGLTSRCVRDLAVDPAVHLTLLAAVNDPAPGAVGIWRSTDGGQTWIPSDAGLETTQVLELAFDPLAPATVYAATWHGLFGSADGGRSWERAAGPLGYVPVFSVAAAAREGRTLVYVGTVGGSLEGLAFGQTGPEAGGSVEAGVYRLARVSQGPSRVYLPFTLRNR